MASEPRAHVPTPPPFLSVFPSSPLRDTCPPSGAPRATVEPDVASRKKHRLRFPENGEDSHQIKGLAWHLKLVALTLIISLVRLSHRDVLHPLWNSQPNTHSFILVLTKGDGASLWPSPQDGTGHFSAHPYSCDSSPCAYSPSPHSEQLHIST